MGFTILDTKGDANRTMASLLLITNSPYYAVLSGDSDFLVYKNSRLVSFGLLKFSKGVVQVGHRVQSVVSIMFAGIPYEFLTKNFYICL